jgi:hypothetical protein
MIVHKKIYFKGVQQVHRVKMASEVVQTSKGFKFQKEHADSKGSQSQRYSGGLEGESSLSGRQPSGPYGREAYSKTIKRVSWVEMARTGGLEVGGF